MARSAAPIIAAFMAIFLIAAPYAAESAVSCGTAVSYITPCVNYARGVGGLTAACCNGVRGLNAAATTTKDRQDACTCLKGAAARMPGLNGGRLAGLPGSCGVKLPYTVSTSMNCATVH